MISRKLLSQLQVLSSLLLVLLLVIIPRPAHWQWLQPCWPVLLLVYWFYVMPDQIGLIMVGLTGLLLDFLSNSFWGEHALVLLIIAYLILRLQGRITLMPVGQQVLIVAGFTLIYLISLDILNSLLAAAPANWQYWLTILPTMMVAWIGFKFARSAQALS